jgi:hypothetical protein
MADERLLGRGQRKAASLSLAYTPIQVEFTTIPAYLTALYSITDKTSSAYQALRSVVVEEMFHLNQVANLLVGIGGRPKLTGSATPTYPAYLPSASTTATPYVGLYRASQAVFRNVFMAIETPAPSPLRHRTATIEPSASSTRLCGTASNAVWVFTARQPCSRRTRRPSSAPTSISASSAAKPSR